MIEDFVSDVCLLDSGLAIDSDDLFGYFVAWAAEQGHMARSRPSLLRDLRLNFADLELRHVRTPNGLRIRIYGMSVDLWKIDPARAVKEALGTPVDNDGAVDGASEA